MTQAFIEHVNLSVRNPERTAAMLGAVFGWHIRWQGKAASGGDTIHVGTNTHYIALYADENTRTHAEAYQKGVPLNHIGVQVKDIVATDAKVRAEGLITFNHDDYEPGRRFYFFDSDGIEYEVVSYT